MESLKTEALQFFGPGGVAENVLQNMEKVANNIFYDKPEDINGYIVKYFEKLCCTPTLAKIHAHIALNNGWPSFHVDIQSKACNDIKIFKSCGVSNLSKNLGDIIICLKYVEESIEIINNILSPKFCNIILGTQIDVDDCLKEYLEFCRIEEIALQNDIEKTESYEEVDSRTGFPKSEIKDAPNDVSLPSFLSVAAVSRALCVASSILLNVPLYKYISDSFNINPECHFSVPAPLMTMFSSRQNNGKFKLAKELLLIPAPNVPPNEVMRSLVKILDCYQSSLSGEEVRALAKPSTEESEIELLKHAISQSGYSCGKDFFLGLNCAANEIYQNEKELYETNAGVYKSAVELRRMWIELILKHPQIICLIDPFHKKDKNEWEKLCGQVSSKCFVIKSFCDYHQDQNEEDSLQSSGLLISLEDLRTVSDIWIMAFKKKSLTTRNFLLFSKCDNEICDTFPVDMAVALRSVFIKAGDVSMAKFSIVLNRLSQIYEEISFREVLAQPCDHFTFNQVGPVYDEEDISDVTSNDKETEFKPSKSKKLSYKK